MSINPVGRVHRLSVLILACAGCLSWPTPVFSQTSQHLSVTQPGGMPGRPVITGIQRSGNNFVVTWEGPAGNYQLYKKSLGGLQWQSVGGASSARSAVVSGTNLIFRVGGLGLQYGGSDKCIECHGAIQTTVSRTPHSQALNALRNVGQDRNPSCLPCHTVGYGLPGGFTSASATPQLGGVGCESCHGPAANHAANENDPIARPRVDASAAVCGGCHNTPEYPTYTQWAGSAHARVTPGVLSVMNSSQSSLSGCGRCHSGTVRLSLVQREPLPVGDANVGVVCVVCHDPHQLTGNPAQLRNPVSSTNNYSLSTSANFTTAYRANVGICAQCHNDRGASWTTTSAPPHPSMQYNMLLGTVGELASGQSPNQPAAHALDIEKQCVGCHMPTPEHGENPFGVGPVPMHEFTVSSYDLCLDCHPFPEELADFTADAVRTQIQQVKAALDLWATTKAPEALRTRYGVRAWEYTNPGRLSNPPGVTAPGPTAAEQDLIPVNIRKARFNLYLVYGDGSFGVHNALYASTLIETARNWVQAELNR